MYVYSANLESAVNSRWNDATRAALPARIEQSVQVYVWDLVCWDFYP